MSDSLSSSTSPRSVRGLPAVVWVAATVQLVWLSVTLTGGGASGWQSAWPIALTMVLGSFIAGATSEGGGAVAFPVLTLLFAVVPHEARDFSWLIQAVGMNAAGFVIWRSATPVVRAALLPATLGGAVGVALGLWGLRGLFDPAQLKLGFTSVWVAFAGVLVWSLNSRAGSQPRQVHAAGVFAVAVLGGLVSSLFGTGLDICVFSWLVLRCGVDERIATPTSVVLMGWNAALGVGMRSIEAAPFSTEVLSWWWACVPVVVWGAPLGARWLRGKSRRVVVTILVTSIIAQYVGALAILPLSASLLIMSLITIGGFGATFSWMARR